jgi:hypothetical protein
MGSGHAAPIPHSKTGAQGTSTVAPQQDPSGTAAEPDLEKMLATVRSSHAAPPARTPAATAEEEEETEDVQAVAMPTPKIKGRKHSAARSAPEHAPTLDDILAPQEPAFDKASTDMLRGSIVRVVTDLYDKVLAAELQLLKADLQKTKPPPPTPYAEKLLGFVVQEIATWALGSIGRIVAKEVFGNEAAAAEVAKAQPRSRIPRTLAEKQRQQQAQETAEAVSISSPPKAVKSPKEIRAEAVSERVAKTTGNKLNEGITEAPEAAPDVAASKSHRIPGSTLLETFISLENGSLLAQKERAILMIETLMSSAAARGAELAELDAALLKSLESAPLRSWFHYKVTMEWLNFVARASVGARAEGQTTTMPGANEIDGVASHGANRIWRGAAGFVEITVRLPDRVRGLDGVSVRDVSIPSSFGAATKLKDLATIPDGTGTSYSLATLPVFRRVWLKSGDSALASAPAVVIMPDGTIEFDANNPSLAAIGSMQHTRLDDTAAYYMEGTRAMTEEQRSNPAEWLRRATRASQCQVGAHMIYAMLNGVSPGAIDP